MFETMMDEMKLRNFSKNTVTAYLFYNKRFIDFCDKKTQEVTEKDIRKYLLIMIASGKSSSTVNLAHNALNFYYKTIMKRKFDVPFQKREHKERQLASRSEIIKMIKLTKNNKHKLIISLLYASGVRVSELVKIKISHIDFENKLLLVKQGKGSKDRFTILSNLVLFEIKRYLKSRPYKNDFLFASHKGHISTRTVEQVIQMAKKKANLNKNITPHSLRHSFATHHVDTGTRTEFIQKMLGHKDIRTTQIYERITTKHLMDVKSPHDGMVIS